MMPRVCKEIEIEAPAVQVWTYVGSQAGLQQWWGAEITLEEKEGGRCEERGMHNGVPYHRIGRVAIYDPPRQIHLALEEVGHGWPAAITISLTLTEAGERTTVTVIEEVHVTRADGADAPRSAPSMPHFPSYPPTLQAPLEDAVASTAPATAVLSTIVQPARNQGELQTEGRQAEQLWSARLERLRQSIRLAVSP